MYLRYERNKAEWSAFVGEVGLILLGKDTSSSAIGKA